MPTSVLQLLFSANIGLTGNVRWGQAVESNATGVYIVSLSADPALNSGILKEGPISIETVRTWISNVPTIELDGRPNPKPEAIAERLSKFWLSDENVLYIGKTNANSGLSSRLQAYYSSDLGKRGPHRGGHWIKTLENLGSLRVYFAECALPEEIETTLLKSFINGVSENTRSTFFDRKHPFPFANLEYREGHTKVRKTHGIDKSTK
jgi:hypothetical protein